MVYQDHIMYVLKEKFLLALQATRNSIFKERRMPEICKDANIMPKEDKQKNYRPVFLMNNDYKLFLTILAGELKIISQDFIQEDQCGFLLKIIQLAEKAKLASLIKEKILCCFIPTWKPFMNLARKGKIK